MPNSHGLLLNPNDFNPQQFDPETRRQLRALIEWFEERGKVRLLRDDLDASWVTDFLDFIKRERVFATFLTPSEFADGDSNKRWDTSRNAVLSEILGFYGLAYWYAEQVTILGLGPIWQSDNIKAKERAAAQLEAGGVMAFALSEREHGADIYNTDLLLTPTADEGDDARDGVVFRASGEKYYIGNGNVAGMVSVFSRRTDVDGPDGYVWFVADSGHQNYELIGNVVHGQMFVSTFRLNDYPVHQEDILCTGPEAFSAALNTVNVGKFNLCSGSIGMCEHAFYEAITHANNRILYGNPVTDFPHVRASFVDVYARLIAMKLFSDRAIDYFRSASLEDRRYLLFNPVTKSKVTSEGERVVTLLWDVLAAKGFEKNTYFSEVNRLIGALPRLEGTVHVNVAQILKFMPNYMFNPGSYPQIGTRDDAADDVFFWEQGPARGASKVQFADWAPVYERNLAVPNVARFYEQVLAFKDLLATAAPDADQQRDLDFVLVVGHLFTLVVYGQLILEQAELTGLDRDLVDQIFDFQIRDFSSYAVALHGKPSSTVAQQEWALSAIRKPVADGARFDRVWAQVQAYDGAYEMRP
ncbi:acyl-CoA dehydrogenase [Mycobacterium sp. CBMA293]|uniref:acyl-CoA dehydrogenase family protein n=1 Tax=unclassified Mycolicibacterium TaxID=2636767 RepID=UPI0012DF0B8A|nr:MULTISPECIES: acyl-CoA dehydrogenase family protein [unclassified Mycolicibacterium]MUL47947.1 acyl-CoA dehydrogenase [Mycolicibacterium sp. CBMA 360]MUL59205.1 acyl-CoA dehydrogenase [Mycolicibacterium sp. CBMA 335]MUL70930.1 acyl-CoA dehydrogenase [Mycolicibacterium sp. CBMA 311]MUL94573.1 acyl-CoA dehydrogenase [Mycolicibacterium sp. CBMA 230]MUM09250.1 acyl-CoA dehydrogenase [Mycolicibacterium sp. CBMA 213]